VRIAELSNSTTTSALNCNYNIHLNLDKDCFSFNYSDIDYAVHNEYIVSLFCYGGNEK